MANEIYIDGISEPEGPVWGADGSFYLVEMGMERRCLTQVGRDGRRRVLATTARRPNGLARDGDGRLWVAEAYEGALICYSSEGEELKRIEGDAEGRFLWPNDLVFTADGRLYMTDSGIVEDDLIGAAGIRADHATAPYDGRVYEIDPAAGKVVRKIDSGIRFANGVALGPDGLLYVNQTVGGEIFRYDVAAVRPERRLFGNVNRTDLPAGWRGPDGMKFGVDGRLYCTVYGQGDVTILDRDGKLAGRIPTNGLKPTNLAFAPEGNFAMVTEVEFETVERIPTPCAGLPLNYPEIRFQS